MALMTRKEAAAYLKISIGTLKNLHKKNEGPRVVIMGRSVRYMKSELDSYIERCTK